jgi:hypothetical protein
MLHKGHIIFIVCVSLCVVGIIVRIILHYCPLSGPRKRINGRSTCCGSTSKYGGRTNGHVTCFGPTSKHGERIETGSTHDERYRADLEAGHVTEGGDVQDTPHLTTPGPSESAWFARGRTNVAKQGSGTDAEPGVERPKGLIPLKLGQPDQGSLGRARARRRDASDGRGYGTGAGVRDESGKQQDGGALT